MSAFDTPWLESMSKPSTYTSTHGSNNPGRSYEPNPPTVAAFAPTSSSGYSATTKQRSTIIVHKKSPLLVATPPQVTRALAHSHPFILPINKLVGLLSWSTDDPWESFLLLAAFWAVCMYGSVVVRYATPINGVVFLILGMYSRRYSPLSSTSKTGEKHEIKGHNRSSSTPQHKSLDEIVETLTIFTTRCNILLDPFMTMTDFLSTQRTATSATTRPALTTVFIRIVLVTPLWILLTLPPLYIITPRRIFISFGTVMLTWHSRPARVSRVILWRSVFIRKLTAFVTGLDFEASPPHTTSVIEPQKASSHLHAKEFASTRKRRPDSSGVKFTFILYENQRRWIGLGWTNSLFAYERSPWTDEHLNAAPPKDEFDLPEVDAGNTRWRWVAKSSWQIDNGDARSAKPKTSGTKSNQPVDGGGWIYYDNKWNEGRSEDGWGRYTRRRKWFRDAELVEITPSTEPTPIPTPRAQPDLDDEAERVRQAKEFAKSLKAYEQSDLSDSVATLIPETPSTSTPKSNVTTTSKEDKTPSTNPTPKRRSGWFTRGHSYTGSVNSTAGSITGSQAGSVSGTTAASITSKHKPSTTTTSSSSPSRNGTSIARSDKSTISNSSRSRDEDVIDQWRDSSGKVLGVGEDALMSLG